jgi:hypothetical protein
VRELLLPQPPLLPEGSVGANGGGWRATTLQNSLRKMKK